MEFRKTHNLETSKTRYYIDSKRVSYDKFQETATLCAMRGMNYNTSYVYTSSKYNRSGFHYN